jgi:hypothetical protein
MIRVGVVSLLAGGLLVAAGCAQQVGDIDRTQPNKIKKELFDDGSEWHFRQTVSDVHHGNPFFFTGLNTGLEKLRWEIQEDQLIGYRSYEIVPGADHRAETNGVGDTDPATINGVRQDYGQNPEVYKGAPLIGFTISNHFDVQRGYNSSTGEQTNVISENSSDRHWTEREYMRVSWDAVTVSNMSFYGSTPIFQYTHAPGEEYAFDSRSFEYDENGKLVYFEVRVRATVIETPFCYYYELADCAGTEMTIVNSFSRVPEEKTYEAIYYDNEDMFKFGFFRDNRYQYDRQRGLTRSGQIFLANRHDIWKTSYDEDGNLIPLSEREPGHVVYYLNPEMPEDLDGWNKSIEEHWDHAFRRAVAAAKGVDPESIGQIYVVCHNPVRSDDHEACGEEGKTVRVGDVRYHHIYWVPQVQLSGPLGYGPSGTDPETGEILSGTAYVYGASVDRYATYGLDIVNLQIACQDDQDSEDCQTELDSLTDGENVRVAIYNRLTEVDPRANVSAELRNIRVPKDFRELMPAEQLSKMEYAIDNPTPYDHGFWDRRMRQMKESGLDLSLLTDEMVREMTMGEYENVAEAPEEVIEQIRPANWLNPDKMMRRDEERRRFWSKHNIMTTEFADDVVAGLAASLARKYAGISREERDDKIWHEIRGLIYQGVMLHEIGHTVGLRHNFQGSYDSLNYFDEYWALRKQNLRPVEFVSDIFEVSAQTVEQKLGLVVDENGDSQQLPGGMAEYGYSSIMDYGLRFNTDIHGLGKYDEAAIIYGYTSGYDGKADDAGHLLGERGYIEVFNKSAFDGAKDTGLFSETWTAEDLLRSFDGRASLAYSHPLESYHYTTFANSFADVSKIADRGLMRYDTLRDIRAIDDDDDENYAQRPVEVPYMFCSDNWAGVDASCQRWDHGADPYEQAKYVIDGYHDYYWFSHFPRDSLTWSPYNRVSRVINRYMSYLSKIYQELFFMGSNDIMGTYRYMAALSGFNFMNEMLMMPTYGNHVADKNGVLVPCNFADDEEFEGEDGEMTSTDQKCDDEAYDRYVPMGAGRRPYTRYNYRAGHQYYYYPEEAGHFYDFIGAVISMIQSRVQVRDVDTNTDGLSYSLPYWLFFDGQLAEMVGQSWLERPQGKYGQILVGDRLVSRTVAPVVFGGTLNVDPATGFILDSNLVPDMEMNPGLAEEAKVVRPYHGWGQRFYLMLYGMAGFNINYDIGFADENHIFRIGNGEQVEVGEGFSLVTCVDPIRGHQYGAIRNDGNSRLTTAVEFVTECQYWSGKYSEARRRLDSDGVQAAERELGWYIRRMNLMRTLFDIFGRG